MQPAYPPYSLTRKVWANGMVEVDGLGITLDRRYLTREQHLPHHTYRAESMHSNAVIASSTTSGTPASTAGHTRTRSRRRRRTASTRRRTTTAVSAATAKTYPSCTAKSAQAAPATQGRRSSANSPTRAAAPAAHAERCQREAGRGRGEREERQECAVRLDLGGEVALGGRVRVVADGRGRELEAGERHRVAAGDGRERQQESEEGSGKERHRADPDVRGSARCLVRQGAWNGRRVHTSDGTTPLRRHPGGAP